MEKNKVEPEYLTPPEVAELVRVPLKWVRVHSHKIAGYTKVGHHVRYRKSSIMAALAGGKILRD
jgi:hypothetical protein